jgi:hypothetical protein
MPAFIKAGAITSMADKGKGMLTKGKGMAAKGKDMLANLGQKGSDITKVLGQTGVGNMAQDSDTSEYDDLSAKDLIGELESYDQVELPRNAVIKFLSVICKRSARSKLHGRIADYMREKLITAYLESVITKNHNQIVNDLMKVSSDDWKTKPCVCEIKDESSQKGDDDCDEVQYTSSESYLSNVNAAGAGGGNAAGAGDKNAVGADDKNAVGADATTDDSADYEETNDNQERIKQKTADLQEKVGLETMEGLPIQFKEMLDELTKMIIKYVNNPLVESETEDIIFNQLVRQIIDRTTISVQTAKFGTKNYEIFHNQMKPVMDTINRRFYFSTQRLLRANLDNLQKQINKNSIDDDILTSYVETLFQLFYVETNHRDNTQPLPKYITNYVDTIKPQTQTDSSTQSQILDNTIKIIEKLDQSHLLRDVIGGIQYKEDPEKPSLLESFKEMFVSDKDQPLSRLQRGINATRNLGSTVKTFLTRNPAQVAPITPGGKRTKRRVYKRGNKKNLTIRKRK